MDDLRARLRRIAASEMAADTAHDLAHLDRVWRNARTIAETDGGDLRILLAASYLHDLVNLPKDAPDRAQASRLSAARARGILPGLGYSDTEVAAVAHAIAAHSHSAGIIPETLEASVLRDADRLDALGAIGLARVFAVSGQLGRPLYDPDDPFAARRAPDDGSWALDHFAVKLLRLEAGMLTNGGRALAVQRTRVLRDYLETLESEIG